MRVVIATILGMFFGLLVGIGLYELLVQAGSFDPVTKRGLAFPAAGVVVGALLGIFGGRRRRAAA